MRLKAAYGTVQLQNIFFGDEGGAGRAKKRGHTLPACILGQSR